MRVFVLLRRHLTDDGNLKDEIEQLEKKIEIGLRQVKVEKNFEMLVWWNW